MAMNKSLSDEKLSQLSSLKELKQAKIRVDRAIRYAEEDLRDEYDSAKDMFSFRETIALGLTVFDNVQCIVRYLGKGLYSGIAKSFRRRMRRDEMVNDDEC